MIVPERVTIDRTLICALSFLYFLVLFLPLYTLYDPIHTRSNNNRLLLTPNFLHSAHTLAMSPPHPHPQVWNNHRVDWTRGRDGWTGDCRVEQRIADRGRVERTINLFRDYIAHPSI